MKEGISVRGDIHFVIRDKYGRVKTDDWERNLIVSVGRAHIADQMSGKLQAVMSHMAIGTGSTAPAAGDTALQTELDRNALTSKTQGTGSETNKVTYIADWASGDGTGAITEAGLFNSASAGTMLCRSTFSVKNKGPSDSLTMTWVITFTA